MALQSTFCNGVRPLSVPDGDRAIARSVFREGKHVFEPQSECRCVHVFDVFRKSVAGEIKFLSSEFDEK